MAKYQCRNCGVETTRKSDLSRIRKYCGVCIAFLNARELILQRFPGTVEYREHQAKTKAGMAARGYNVNW